MRHRTGIVICWACQMIAAPGAATAADPVSSAAGAPTPLAVFGRLPSLENVALSPSGSRLAFVKTIGDQRVLVIAQFGDQKPLGVMRVADSKLRSIMWTDEDDVLIIASTTQYPPFGFIGGLDEWFLLATYNVTNKRLRPVELQVSDEQTFNSITDRPMIRNVDGKTTLFVPGWFIGDQPLPALFRVDVPHLSARIVARSGLPITDWAVDASGQVAAELEYDETKQAWALRARRNGAMGTIASGSEAIDIPRIVGFSGDGESLIVSFKDHGKVQWRPLSLRDGQWGAPLTYGADFDEVLTDRMTDRLTGGVELADKPRYVFFDPQRQSRWNTLMQAFGGERVELVSHSDDFSKLVVRVFGAVHGDEYRLIDWHTVDAESIGDVYSGLSSVAAVSPVRYAAADGLVLDGFLTLPQAKPPRRLPLIVLPHGGPAAADRDDFDWWAQALASRGYAVLQVNYRGSNVDRRLLAAGFGEWGRKMQTDLSDGVRYLAQQGTIDPRRVCIVGASYGGYAALAGVALQADIYRCAVAVAGVADLKRFLIWTNENRNTDRNLAQRYWDRYLGVSGPDDPAVHAISPIDHLVDVKVPVLLIHGRDDTVVPFDQSKRMADALERAGKQVRLIALKGEDHWLSRSATRLQMLEACVAFLEANNPPN